jgi:hypothetical protein
VPHLATGDELARSPTGDYLAVQCDLVQNSDSGRLRRVTLCVVGPHILAVAGGNRRHDDGRRLEGYVEEIPDADAPSWARALRRQAEADVRYYPFYLRRNSYGDDTPDDDAEEASRQDPVPGLVLRPTPRGGAPLGEALCRGLAVAALLTTLAGWLVWLRLWQHRRRVATWIVPG